MAIRSRESVRLDSSWAWMMSSGLRMLKSSASSGRRWWRSRSRSAASWPASLTAPRHAQELFLGGGVGKDDRIVLVLARDREPLGVEHRNHLARHVANAHHLPDRILGSEELIAHRATDHADVGGPIDVVLGERGPLVHDPALDVEVVGGDAAVRRVPVLVAVDHLHGRVDVGRDALDERNLVLDRHRIGERQRLRPAHARSNPVHRPAPGLDPDEVVPEIVHLLLDLGLAGLADGDHADHRGDSDRDAEDGQKASRLVAEQSPERGSEESRAIHACPRQNENPTSGARDCQGEAGPGLRE